MTFDSYDMCPLWLVPEIELWALGVVITYDCPSFWRGDEWGKVEDEIAATFHHLRRFARLMGIEALDIYL